MNLFAEILSTFIAPNTYSKMNNCIYYKLVDSKKENEYFLLQCINKKATFHAKLSEIVFDTDILHGLHPIQSCYIGLEYSKHAMKESNYHQGKSNNYSVYRYGKFRLSSQNREGNICFINESTNEAFLMDPRDVCLSKDLIQEFDAAQAFYIGLLAGLKINNPITRDNINNKSKPYLRVIK